jgi:hypothetical protein
MTWTDGENLRSMRTLKLFAKGWVLLRFAAGLMTLAIYRQRVFQKSSIAFVNTFVKVIRLSMLGPISAPLPSICRALSARAGV